MYASKPEGGISMPNLLCQNKSLKASWIQRLLQDPAGSWASMALKKLPPAGTAIFLGNISCQDVLDQILGRGAPSLD